MARVSPTVARRSIARATETERLKAEVSERLNAAERRKELKQKFGDIEFKGKKIKMGK